MEIVDDLGKTVKNVGNISSKEADALVATLPSNVGRNSLTACAVTKGMEINPAEVNVFRGGPSLSLKPNDFQVDKATGLVKTTQGVSLDIIPGSVEKFGGAFRIRQHSS